jgi:hypothetical protein
MVGCGGSKSATVDTASRQRSAIRSITVTPTHDLSSGLDRDVGTVGQSIAARRSPALDDYNDDGQPTDVR